jgi:hypothetical protein
LCHDSEAAKLSSGSKRRAVGDLAFGQRIALLLSLLVVVFFVIAMLGPILQDHGYHLFADRRTLFGNPNFNDVVSNIGFALGALSFFRMLPSHHEMPV